MIIGFSGKMNSGKDFTAKQVQTFLQEKHDTDMGFPTWEIKKYAGKLKQIASLLTGIPEIAFEDRTFKASNLSYPWQMSVREFLQRLGTEALREGLDDKVWINALFADYRDSKRWLITDVRFINEAEAIHERGGIIVKINRPDAHINIGGSMGIEKHPSESELDHIDFDYTLENSGDYHEYQDVIRSFVSTIKPSLDDIRTTQKQFN